jgi:hypothetical protein
LHGTIDHHVTEISQTLKDKYSQYSHMWNSNLIKNDMNIKVGLFEGEPAGGWRGKEKGDERWI